MLYSVLLIGQSNAAGRGVIGAVEPLPTERQYVQRMGRWRPMYVPVCPDRSNAGICFAESFAYRFSQHYNTSIGIIPCAFGGSKVAEWMPGTPLYDNAVFCSKMAMRDSKIVAVLWQQGESDSLPGLYETWGENVLKIFESMRKDIGLGDDVPFLMGGIPDYIANYEGYLGDIGSYYTFINDQIEEMAEKNEWISYVPAYDTHIGPDDIHLCAADLRIWGENFFKKFVEVSDLVPAKEYVPFEAFDDRFEKQRAAKLAAEKAAAEQAQK